jgi:hypothetical protein
VALNQAIAQTCGPKYKHYADTFVPDLADKFLLPFEDVVESLYKGDYDHLESITGDCLKHKLRVRLASSKKVAFLLYQ